MLQKIELSRRNNLRVPFIDTKQPYYKPLFGACFENIVLGN